MSRGASLGAILTSGPGWTQIVDCDGSSTAGFFERGSSGVTWVSNGTEIEVFPGGTGFPEQGWFLDESGDEVSPLISVEVEVLVPSQVSGAGGGVGLFNTPSAGSPDDGNASFIQLFGSTGFLYVAVSNASPVVSPVAAGSWATLRIDAAFGIGRFYLDGVSVGSNWLGNSAVFPERLAGVAEAYPALYGGCINGGLGPMFRNFKAWNANTGPWA